jgi:nitrate reductase alpha subunit
LSVLDEDGDNYQMGRFLRATDVAEYADEENSDWKLLMTDGEGNLHLPTGSLGFRWEKEPSGNWNLQLKNAVTHEEFDPLLTLLGNEDQNAMVSFR